MPHHDLENKIDLYGPLAQAERCLALWLKAENLGMAEDARRRTAALMARYFMHEDQVTDELMLSFLQHYSKRKHAAPIDLEDPASVRMEIKTLLDGAEEKPKRFPWAIAAVIFIAAVLGIGAWYQGSQPINEAQQAELRNLVRAITDADPALSSAAVWKTVKEPLHVRSYQDIAARDFEESRARLRAALAEASARAGVRPVVNGQ